MSLNRERKGIIRICVAMFFGFAFLAYLFPYTGDDWAWGSSIGIERLKIFFAGYNGRYVGNLLVLLLTRSKLLDAAVIAASFLLVCWLSYAYAQDRSKASLLMAALLLLMMPRQLWAQVAVWTAGFTNYVPSALISVAYLIYSKEITGKKLSDRKDSWGHSVILFLAGFCGALFVESITVFHICLSAAVIAYMFLKFRSFRRGHLGFLLGTLAGTWAMFSNSTYGRIATGEDYYRRMPVGLRDTVYFALDQARNILDFVLSENLLFCAIVTVLLLILSVQCVKNGKKWALLPAAFHVGSLLLLLWEDAVCAAITGSFAFPKLVIHTIPIVPPVLYALSILVAVVCLVEKGRRFGMLLPFYCVVVSLAPLLVVHPVGWRCVFIGYFFMIVFTVDLFGYVCRQMLPREKWLSRTLGLVVMAQFVLFVNIFYPIHYYDTLRLEYIKKQAAEGKKTVLMCDLPNREYLYDSLPDNETLAQRYQLFYGLDTDLKFEFIPFEELEKLAKENS